MISFISFIRRVSKGSNPPSVEKRANPLRFGILGAAKIGPDALIKPARYHEDVVVTAIASRSKDKASEFAKAWGVEKAYSGSNAYQELVDDPDLDAIYNPLPNSLHFEWTMKALAAGKHVLCEKPFSDTEEEARKMFALAKEKNLVLLEAFQPRFHPSMQRVKQIIDSGELGKITHVSAELGVWNDLFFVKDDIRFNYELGGGGLMDMGAYCISNIRYLLDATSIQVREAEATTRKGLPQIDLTIRAKLAYHPTPDLPVTIYTDSDMEKWGPFKLFPQWIKMVLAVECESGRVEIRNYVLPHVWHSITVIPTHGKSRVEKAYKFEDGKGEEWWSAYRWQLEAFVDKIRGREPQAWITPEQTIETMKTMETIYIKAGLSARPSSNFVL